MAEYLFPLDVRGYCRVNRTLHGRSVYRPADVPGHNVFHGYNRPGWGDGVDLFCLGGTPVRAMEDCRQEMHQGDGTRKEVITLRGAGLLVVYAHISAKYGGRGAGWRQGDVVGWVRKELGDPHLHLEVFEVRGGAEHPLTGATAQRYLARLRALCGLG